MKTASILIAAALALSACAGPEYIKGAGVRAEPPAGWVDYCARHPDDSSCAKTP